MEQRRKGKKTKFQGLLKVASWNIQGVKTKTINKLEDSDVLKCISQNDIIGISETHTNKSDTVNIDGFHHIRNDRSKHPKAKSASGGIVVFIKNEIKQGVSLHKKKCSEITWIKLTRAFFNLEQDIYIAFVYACPRNSSYANRQDYDALEILQDDIYELPPGSQYMVMGDLNARTAKCQDYISNDGQNSRQMYEDFIELEEELGRQNMDQTVSEQGKRLLEICKSSNMRIVNGRKVGDSQGAFTCYKHNGQSAVDYCLARATLYDSIRFFQVHDLMGDISDHCMVSCSVKMKFGSGILWTNDCVDPAKSVQKYIWDANAKVAFTQKLASENVQKQFAKLQQKTPETLEQVNEMVSKFSEILRDVADSTVKKVNLRKKKPLGVKKKWYDVDCNSLKKAVRELAKKMKMGNGQDRIRFFTRKKEYTKLLKFKKKEYKNKLMNRMNELNTKNPKEYWGLLNELKQEGVSKDEENLISPEAWFNHFQKLNTDEQEDSGSNIRVQNEIHEREQVPIFTDMDYRINNLEIGTAIDKLKGKKAVCFDGISNEMLKCCKFPLKNTLCWMFNVIYTSGLYPDSWCEGYIKPIHKKGSKNLPENYRGITIGSCLGKLFGGILNKRLEKFMIDNGITHDFQNGFKKGSRTSDNMFILKTLVEKYVKNKRNDSDDKSDNDDRQLYTCFVDFKTAYDRVWRNGLFLKMLRCNIGPKMVNIVKCMYSKVNNCVCLGKEFTKSFDSRIGVRQGDVLSPLLFNLYIHDLTHCFKDSGDFPLIGNIPIKCLMYADDMVVMSTSKEGLQSALDDLHSYCREWKLEVNVEKTKVVIFTNKKKRLPQTWTMGEKSIESSDSYKYLGIDFTYSGSFKDARDNLNDKAMRTIFKMLNLSKGGDIPVKLGLKLFNQLVKPILLYGAEIWCLPNNLEILKTKKVEEIYGDKAKSTRITGEKACLKYGRYLLGVHRKSSIAAIRGELGLFPLYIECIVQTIKYWLRVSEMGPASLLGQVYEAQNKMVQDGKECWLQGIKRLLGNCNLGNMFNQPEVCDINCVREKFENNYVNVWNATLWDDQREIGGNKLRTYREIKQDFTFENYLDTNFKIYRNSFTRFRISAHTLNIERGRYTRTPLEERLCIKCSENIVEDEYHLFTCVYYKDLQTMMGLEVQSRHEFINILYNAQDTTVKYVHLAMEKRNHVDQNK